MWFFLLSDIGTDFKSNYEFKNGDLILVSEEDNLNQAITNRLTTKNGSMSPYYNDYGSYLRDYFGSKKDKATLEFIRIECNLCLKQDPRLQEAKISTRYDDKGKIVIEIDDSFNDDTDLSLSLVMNEDTGVNIIGS